MSRIKDIEEKILSIKSTIIEGKKEIRSQPVAMNIINGRIAKLEQDFEDQLDKLETERRFLLDDKNSKATPIDDDQLMPTVFFAWESDHSVDRSLIKNALEEATKDISRDITITEDPRLDHDTKGASGSPDIQTMIFDKIEKAALFVADVSIVTPEGNERPSPNPNVLIELGYAVGILGWQRVILVMNTAHGKHEQLPFDIRGKRVLAYSFSKDSENDKSTVKKELKRDLISAISLGLKQVSKPMQDSFVASFGDFKDYKSIRICNVSNEAIEDLKVTIFWLDGGVQQSRILNSFFSDFQNPAMENSTDHNFLKSQQEIISTSPPHYSDDGNIQLLIEGKGNASQRTVRFNKTLKNQIRAKWG